MDKSDDSDLKSNIFHYFRQKLYNHMLNASKEGISRFKGDVSFHLYHSMALMLVNRLEEGIHDLQSIRMENDIKLAVSIALMYGHKLLRVNNKELFAVLDGQMRELRRSAEAIDFYHSAFVLVCLSKLEKALDYAEKALAMQSSLWECLTLKGWILLQLRTSTNSKRANVDVEEIFECSLQQNPRNLDAIIGLTEFYLLQNNFTEALNTINKAVVRYNNSTNLPLLQKLRIQLAAVDWDQALETSRRIINTDPKNLFARKVLVIIHLCRSANFEEAHIEFRKYIQLLETEEPGNWQLILENAQVFSKTCMRSVVMLLEVNRMLEIVLQNNPENIELIVELGYQEILRMKYKEALRYFRSATTIDEACASALVGLSLCEVKQHGKTERLHKHLSFLTELTDTKDSLLLHFIQAKISDSSQETLRHLNTICEAKLSLLKSLPFSDSYLLLMDLEFLIETVRESMKHVSTSKDAYEGIYEILKVIVKVCPGMSEALFLLAKLQCMRGDNTNAMNNLEKLFFTVTVPHNGARLLMARIQVQHGLFDRAAQTLEVAVSNQFSIREEPMYHYISALVDKNANNYADAIKSLTKALSLARVKPKQISDDELSLMDKSSMYVELIDTLNIVGQADEATKVLEEATEDLQDTPEEARILLLTAENLLLRKNIQGAVDLLSRIKPTDSCYKEAKSKHAEVLLNYRNDKYAYVQCYLDNLKENPGAESYVMLGDAYMKILEPDQALESYEKALKENPKDPSLMSKMGKALVETHYFDRAVAYYKKAIQNTNDPELKLQLAELYMNLKEFEKGELLLLNELEDERAVNLEDLTYLRFKTRLLNLLAQIQEKSGNTTYALKSLRDAMENQDRVRRRLALEQDPIPEDEINILVEISMKLGEMAMLVKNNEQAINYYKEGLVVSRNNITLLVALAKLYMQMNYLELCQQTSANILRLDPGNETASVMMADIAFRKVDFDMALFHFTQLVTKQPKNWEALVRLIEILRRTGNIKDSAEFINKAEQKCENSMKETGFLYCRALFQWYSGNLNGALKNFNSARPNQVFGLTAIYNMIEICLNPDDDIMGDQMMDTDNIEYRDSRSMALKTADRLLKELKQRLEASGDGILKYRLLSNFRLLATKEKHSMERALEDFVSLASENAYKDNIGVTFGIATAYTLLKQAQRAKNQLKRIVKTTWTFEDAEYLERCWLLLADHYIQSAKFDNATELINKVVQHNKGSAKAYEYLGYIAEKEQRYNEASRNYELAFIFSGKTNQFVGYKLAQCFMKCRNYACSVEIAHDVLALNPDYPRIKKDILEKCMNNLRT